MVEMSGILIQQIDKILIPFLIPENEQPMEQLGIYGAGVKIAVLMNMFIQAFRYAFEPFFFSQTESKNDKNIHAQIMKYFVIFGLLIFLGMTLYIDVIKLIIPLEYEEGFSIVPVIMLANLFFGIYFTLSLWYKLTDMTRYGAYISLIGAAITIILNFILIPVYGYKGSAVTLLTAFFIMMVISYFLGRKYYPIPYNLKRIGFYFFVTMILFAISLYTNNLKPIVKYPVHTIFIFIFIWTVFKFEKNSLRRLFNRNKKK
jgi:O-antigen/teichoic acid export membrane protein